MRKKGFIKLAACTLVLAMTLSLGACSDSKDDKDDDKDRRTRVENNDDDDTDADDNDADVDNSDADDNDNSSAKFSSMEEYLADPTVSSQLNALKNAMTDPEMSMDIRGEGNKLIYTIKCLDIVKEEGMAEILEEEADREKSQYIQTAEELKSYVAVDNPVVVVEYLDANDEMIFTKEFAAE